MKPITNQDPVFLRIDSLLKEQGKKQKDLLEFLDIRKTSYSEWKSGTSKTYLSRLNDISTYLNTTPDYIVSGKEKGASIDALDEMDIKLLGLFHAVKKGNKEKVLRIMEMLVAY